MDSLRAYQVYIDGQRYGEIENGKFFKCRLRPGQHFIHLKCDYKKTKQIEFNLAQGFTATFECGIAVGVVGKLLLTFNFFSEAAWFDIQEVHSE